MKPTWPRSDQWRGWRLVFRQVLALLVLIGGCEGVLGQTVLTSKTLAKIRDRGEITIGVKTDFEPFGSLDAQGNPVGFEVDLARLIADGLGVRLKKIAVSTENRFMRLEQGTVDLVIATTGDTRERRALATAIEPNYYGAGVTVMLRPERQDKEWKEIRGQRLCALQGAYFNKPITQRHIVNLQMYRSVRDAEQALKKGQCIGFLYTDVAIEQILKHPEWSGYKATLPSIFIVPWAINVARGESGTEFERLIGDMVAGWHRAGTLIELEKKWQIRPSRFLEEARGRWREKSADGRYVCERNADGQWPLQCRNPAFVTSAEVSGIEGIGLWIREAWGMDISLLYDPYDRTRYFQGFLWTMLLSAASILGSLIIGYWGAKAILAGRPALRRGFVALANFGRMTPPLLQMYLVFFGLGGLVWTSLGMSFAPFAVAVFCLSFYHGSMIVFAFLESARHLAETRPAFVLSLRELPSLVASAGVGLRTALSNLTKATTIASAIAVPELLSATLATIADQGNLHVMMCLLLVVFFGISSFWLHVILWAERKVARWDGAR